MKEVALKWLFLVSVFILLDYLIMIIVGCVSGYFDCSSNYYECTFCTIGKYLVGISAILFALMMINDFKSVRKNLRAQ